MKKYCFTLIELLVAIAIISILAAIVASGGSYVQTVIDEATTSSAIQKLELALESYREEYGFYYMSSTVDDGSVKYESEGTEFNPNPSAKLSRYSLDTILKMDFGMVTFCSRAENAKSMNSTDDDFIPETFLGEDYQWEDPSLSLIEKKTLGLKDAWGNLLMYRFPGKYNKTKFDIWSRGPDGVVDGLSIPADDPNQSDEDDITNWKLRK